MSNNHDRNDEDMVSMASTQGTSPMRDLLPLPRNENTIMSAFVEAGLTSMMPLLSFKPNDQVDKTDSEEEKEKSLLQSMSSKRRMNRKMRVVQKAGLTNVTYKNISKKKRKYFSDLYTTLLDASWCQGVLLFSACFFASWFLFASFYYFLSFLHGDLANTESETHIPCILGLDGFLSSFLFSLETQHTIGYGTRAVTTECVDVVLVAAVQVDFVDYYKMSNLMCSQCVFGLLLQALLLGLIFSKLSKPRMRTKTVMFSRCAVINQRNKKLCLIFRIGDLRDDNFILGTQVGHINTLNTICYQHLVR